MPSRDTGIIGQAGVGACHRLFELTVVHPVPARDQHGAIGGLRLAGDPGLGDGRLRREFGFDPGGVDVASVGRDEDLTATPPELQVVAVPFAEIAGGPDVRRRRLITQIAQHHIALDQHLAILGEADTGMGKRLADATGTALAGSV